REVFEETSIDIKNNKSNGLRINYNELMPILKVEFLSTLFEIENINDIFYTFGTTIDRNNTNQQNQDFLNKLFDEHNKDGKNYSLKYENNEETEFIHAVKIDIHDL